MMEKMETIEDIQNRVTSLEKRFLSLEAVISERQKRKQDLEKECLEKGFDPNNLEEEIQNLERLKATTAQTLIEKLNKLEGELEVYELQTG